MKDLLKYVLTGILSIVLALTIQKMFMDPAPQKDWDYFEQRLDDIDREIDESQKIINTRLNQIETRNETITKDSLTIINSDRAYRDSLRRIHNPINGIGRINPSR